jgi:uncharacterized protein (DUF885 family)
MTSEKLADLAARYWTFRCEEFPITAITAGEQVSSDILLREAPADHERRANWAQAALEELAEMDSARLSAQERGSRGLLESEFTDLVALVAHQAHLRPTIYPLGPNFMLTYWADTTAIASLDDARRYLARMARIPEGLGGVEAALAEGVARGMRYPRLVVGRALSVIRNQAGIAIERNAFFRPLSQLLARGGQYAEIAEQGREIIEETVVPAMFHYADCIETVVGAAARDDLACVNDIDGPAYYQLAIRQHTTTALGADEIHALGQGEVARITAAMLDVAAAAGFEGDLAGFRRRLAGDNRQFSETGDALREEFEVLSKRIDGMIPRFFGRTPRSTYGVSSIAPEIAEAMPPAYAQPNPVDRSAAGVHWITSIPSKLPRYLHVPIALHEAWPGHLMHFALIQELEALPAFRRNGAMRYSVCLEGWALYCEALGDEMGLYDSPEKTYGRLEMEMWRAVRLVVDTGIHAKGWSRAQSIQFFQENMALPIETVEAEVDRYIAWPGQALAYQIGNLKFRELRERSERKLGDRFDVRKFHDALMSAGAVTLDLLDQTIDDWIEAQELQAA